MVAQEMNKKPDEFIHQHKGNRIQMRRQRDGEKKERSRNGGKNGSERERARA
jgi:hypothetical protein